MLACQISRLTRFWSGIFIKMVFAPISGVQVSEGGGTVPVREDGERVNVVDERSVQGRGETGEVYGEEDTGAVGVCGTGYAAGYQGTCGVVEICRGENGDVCCWWVVGLNSGVAARTWRMVSMKFEMLNFILFIRENVEGEENKGGGGGFKKI
jgi:hypothetical protein